MYVYSGAHSSGNNKDKHTCKTYIVKSNNGSIENQGIQSNHDVHVYGIWRIDIYVVFVAKPNSTSFSLNITFLLLLSKDNFFPNSTFAL